MSKSVWFTAGAPPLPTTLPSASLISTAIASPPTGNKSKRVFPEQCGVTNTPAVPSFNKSKCASFTSMKFTSRYKPP